jgi:hypothetical protein
MITAFSRHGHDSIIAVPDLRHDLMIRLMIRFIRCSKDVIVIGPGWFRQGAVVGCPGGTSPLIIVGCFNNAFLILNI